MNVHHLELFYYVARHGGIMPAVRHIPYGIQQPAVSSQIGQLEESLGTPLFRRRPFALTPAGERLYEFIQPFFGNLEHVAVELRGGQAQHVRIGASPIVLRDHLPDLLHNVRRRFPKLRVSLREGYPADLELMLDRGEIDLAVSVFEAKRSGRHFLLLLELPLILLVAKGSRVRTADELWQRDRIDEPLICLPPGEAIPKKFQNWLTKRGVDWFPAIEASSTELIETYVANGLGIGLSVALPRQTLSSKVRALPLPEIPPVSLGTLWRGRATPLVAVLLDEARARARELM
ncbi:MAG: LysR family transcriptional regulator [Verrucomicrobiota bacterium]|jgi:DNA-binding transcriptional LysR family regulator